jgi:[ribosomal protein S5]-alanine N-acetyltransferase
VKDILLETRRLFLRELTEDDLPALNEYAGNPEIFRYQESGPFNESETRALLQMGIAYRREEPRRHFELAVVLKDTSRLIGNCGLQISSLSNRAGGIDCILNSPFWNQGLATEITAATLQFGFTELQLHRISATCAPDNLASQKVLIKVGMKKEGCLRQDRRVRGQWRDSLLYAMLEYEWQPHQI